MYLSRRQLEFFTSCNNYFREIFFNPETDDVWKEGDVYTRENFAQTLEAIAENGAEEFYTGQVAKDMIDDLTNLGGILTKNDLENYE